MMLDKPYSGKISVVAANIKSLGMEGRVAGMLRGMFGTPDKINKAFKIGRLKNVTLDHKHMERYITGDFEIMIQTSKDGDHQYSLQLGG